MKQVSENVFVETGKRGCNHSFVVTGEGIVLIDTPFRPTDAAAWRDELKRHGAPCPCGCGRSLRFGPGDSA